MRYTRAGKSTHQRVPAEPTPWEELKSAPPKPARNSAVADANTDSNPQPVKGKFGKNKPNLGLQKGKSPISKKKNEKKFRKDRRREPEVSANFVELGDRKDSKGENDEADNSENQAGGFSKGGKKKVIGEGKTKQVLLFGQFWVSLEEAKRLKALKLKLKQQGLNRKQIDEALRNERRRAEKAARRARDKTCFGCRQFGHLFQDCPKKKEEGEDGVAVEGAGDICFKCGSTEHVSRHCKKSADKFDFAKCFVCSKTGHIARQCPENKKGIYPLGGECNICKELTHLAKDCPTLKPEGKGKKEEEAIVSRVENPFVSPDFEEIRVAEEGKANENKAPAKKRKVKF